MLDLLTYPFVLRALIAGVVSGLLLASLGVFVVVRRMAFFGDGIAHASLAGIALALLVGVAPLPLAILWAVLVALGIYWFERSTLLASDTIIGIFFTASMALGVVLMSLVPGFQPELISFLFGNILTVTLLDVLLTLSVATVIFIWLGVFRRHILFTSTDEASAKISGIATSAHTITLYLALSVGIVLAVKLLGIILVSALLIIPAASSRLVTRTFTSFFLTANLLSLLSVVLGILLSLVIDTPSGATIILVATAVFGLLALCTRLLKTGA